MTRKTITLSIAALAMLAAGCTGVQAQPTDDSPTGNNHPTAAAEVDSSAAEPTEEATTEEPTDDGVAAFGETYTWEDGISITIGKPKPYKPSEWAAYDKKFKHFVVFDVRVVNKTGKAWDPGMITATLQSANEEGDRVFDSEKLPEEPSTKLLNGREAKFKMAFGVLDPKDIVLEIAPDWDHESVLFQS